MPESRDRVADTSSLAEQASQPDLGRERAGVIVRDSKPQLRQQILVGGDRLVDMPGLTECVGPTASNGLGSIGTNYMGIKLVELCEDTHPLLNLSWRIG